MKYGKSKVLVCDLSGHSEKSNIQEAYWPKTSISGQIVSEILPQLCSDASKFYLGLNV